MSRRNRGHRQKMNSLRKWLYKPKKTDTSLLAQFFYADEELNLIAGELDSFDGRKDPERCTLLVNQLRFCQDKVLTVIERIMEEVIPEQRASRDFRVKFPDDVLQENLAGQLWFGAECLAAGSSIMNREVESASMRPLAKAMTRHLDYLRGILRDQCLRNLHMYTDRIRDALVLFDRLFAEFELSYVSAMVPVKTMREYDVLQEVAVLFCETVQRALHLKLLTREMLEDCEPSLMFTIPRLAIISGLIIYPEGPINPDMDAKTMSEMFRPFKVLLYKIRELLWTLTTEELWLLECALCSSGEPDLQCIPASMPLPLGSYPQCLNMWSKQRSVTEIIDEYCDVGVQTDSDEPACCMAQPQYRRSSRSSNTKEDTNCSLDQSQIVDTNSCDQCSIVHQESQDSGMPSDQGSIQDCQSTTESSQGASYRRLRHSASWPESQLAQQTASSRSRAFLSSSPNLVQLLTGPNSRCEPQQQSAAEPRTFHSSLDFDLNLPADTDVPDTPSALATSCNAQVRTDRPDIINNSAVTAHMSANCDHITGIKQGSDNIGSSAYARPEITDNRGDVRLHPETSCTDITPSCSSDDLTKVDREQAASITAELGAACVSANRSCDAATSTACLNCYYSEKGATEGVSEKSTPEDSDETLMADSSECSNTDCISGTPDEQDTHVTTEERVCNDLNQCETRNNVNVSGVGVNIRTSQNDLDLEIRECYKCIRERQRSQRGEASSAAGPRLCGCFRNIASTSENTDSCTDRGSDWLSGAEHRIESVDCDITSGLQVRPSSQGKVNEGHNDRCRGHSIGRIVPVRELLARQSPHLNHQDSLRNEGSDTNSFSSDYTDDEEIALAIRAAETAVRNEVRSRFKDSRDLIHRLFVCIAGVADQLQTNYAADLRHILKLVFDSFMSEEEEEQDICVQGKKSCSPLSEPLANRPAVSEDNTPSTDPPIWVPDEECPHCSACKVPFNLVRRRHHCRNCGKVFCGRCSPNTVPLPHYGHVKPVRVCNHCFMYQVTPFTVAE